MKQFCIDNFVIIGNLQTFSSVVPCYQKFILKVSWLLHVLCARTITEYNDEPKVWKCSGNKKYMRLDFSNNIKETLIKIKFNFYSFKASFMLYIFCSRFSSLKTIKQYTTIYDANSCSFHDHNYYVFTSMVYNYSAITKNNCWNIS